MLPSRQHKGSGYLPVGEKLHVHSLSCHHCERTLKTSEPRHFKRRWSVFQSMTVSGLRVCVCVVGGLRADGASGAFQEYLRFRTCPVPSIDWGVVGFIGGCREVSWYRYDHGMICGDCQLTVWYHRYPGLVCWFRAGGVKGRPVPTTLGLLGRVKWHAVPMRSRSVTGVVWGRRGDLVPATLQRSSTALVPLALTGVLLGGFAWWRPWYQRILGSCYTKVAELLTIACRGKRSALFPRSCPFPSVLSAITDPSLPSLPCYRRIRNALNLKL